VQKSRNGKWVTGRMPKHALSGPTSRATALKPRPKGVGANQALIASYSRSYGLTEETVARLITEGKIR
jgi:hypothetical protein